MKRWSASTAAGSCWPESTRSLLCSAGRRCSWLWWGSPTRPSISAAGSPGGAARPGPRREPPPKPGAYAHHGEKLMEVILLERVAKLGQMGDVVRVKDGYARNFLLPKGKALRATKDNKTKFETMTSQLEVRNLELKSEAEKVGSKLDGKTFVVLRQAGETGQLYGSVSTRDLTAILADGGFTVERSQLALNAPIKSLGLHKVPIMLHPEVTVTISVNIARNADEAERQFRGETLTGRREEVEDADAAGAATFFDNPDALREGEANDQGEGAENAG